MKQTLAISLLVLISLITVKEAVYIALFQVNQNYIAANLCEQKDILEEIQDKTCQGKCYVQKVIVEQQENNLDTKSTNNQLSPTLDLEKTNLIVSNFHFNTIDITTNHPQPIGKLLLDNQGVEVVISSPPQFS